MNRIRVVIATVFVAGDVPADTGSEFVLGELCVLYSQ